MAFKHLRTGLAYDHWANGETLQSLLGGGPALARPLLIFAHILAAEQLWLDRLRQRPQTMPVWPELELGACRELWNSLRRQWDEYLDKATADLLTVPVAYRNTRGESFSSRPADIITHVTLHSGYHRGQIATALRAAGREPAYTDYIHAVRQGHVVSDSA